MNETKKTNGWATRVIAEMRAEKTAAKERARARNAADPALAKRLRDELARVRWPQKLTEEEERFYRGEK